MTHKPGHDDKKPLDLQGDYGKDAATDSDTTVDSTGGYEPGMVWGPRVPGTMPDPFRGGADASERWGSDWTNSQSNQWMSKADAETMFSALPKDQQRLFESLAKASPAWNDTADSVYRKYVGMSAAYSKQGKRMTPTELAVMALNGELPPDGGNGPGGGGGGGGYSGPVTRTDYASEDAFSVRSIADAVSMEMLGRGVEQDEMERILKRVRKYEQRNPQVSTTTPQGPGAATSQTSGGVSSAGYEEVIRRMVAKNPEFGDYQAATTVMGWFDNWLARRGQAVG